jgi:hypothetical protein
MGISVIIAMFTIAVVIGVSAPFWPQRMWDSHRWRAVCGGALLAYGIMWLLIQVWPWS